MKASVFLCLSTLAITASVFAEPVRAATPSSIHEVPAYYFQSKRTAYINDRRQIQEYLEVKVHGEGGTRFLIECFFDDSDCYSTYYNSRGAEVFKAVRFGKPENGKNALYLKIRAAIESASYECPAIISLHKETGRLLSAKLKCGSVLD